MVRRGVILAILLIGLAGLMPVSAQAGQWAAWLYDPDSGQMTMVADTGQVVDEVTLPLMAGYDRYSPNAAVSRNGLKAVYTVTNSQTFASQLVVYDLVAKKTQTTYTPPPILSDSLGYVASETSFNASDTALAYGYSLAAGGWEIVVLDLTGGGVVFKLNANDPVVRAAGISGEMGWTPVIQRYQGAEISFTMGLPGTEFMPVEQGYTWNPVTNTLRADVAYPTFIADTFSPTGEVVMPLMDERLPNQLATLSLPLQNNTLQVYDPAANARYPFYNDPALTFTAAYFIQNGERILVRAVNMNDTTNADPGFWAIIERDGTFSTYVSVQPEMNGLRGLADGFIYSSDLGGQVALIHMQTADGSNINTILWSGAEGARPKLIWVADARTAGAVSLSLRAWAQLAVPLAGGSASTAATSSIAPGALATPTPFGGLLRVLTVGGQATINTTDGDKLNVRSGPGTGYSILVKIPSGTNVTLLEGPRPADGFRWWRVRLSTGLEGWVVESADGVQTLVP